MPEHAASSRIPRVLYVNPISEVGGAEVSLLRLMKGIQEAGIFVPMLVCPDNGILAHRALRAGIEVRTLETIPTTFQDSAIPQYTTFLLNAIRLARLVRQHEVSIVHSNSPRMSYHSGLAARLAGVPSVTHVRDILELPFRNRLKARYLSWTTDVFIAISDAVRKELANLAPYVLDQTRRVHNALDLEEITGLDTMEVHEVFRLPRGSSVIGMFANAYEWKGHSVLLEACSRLMRKIEDVQVLIVGGTMGHPGFKKYERELKSLAHKLGVADHVTFTGWREDALSIMKSIDVVVHPPTKPEPFGLVVLEACALGKAIVASNAGGIPEIVEDGISGILVEPGNPEAFAEAVSRILTDRFLRQTLEINARVRARRFNIDAMVNSVQRIYGSLLDRREMIT